MIEKANFSAKCEEKDALITQMKADFSEEKQSLKNEYQANLTQLEAKYKANLDELKKELAANLAKQNEHFLLQNKEMLSDEGKKMLDEIFAPVKKSVKEYSEKLATNETALQTNIKNMFSFSQEIGKKADELARILKGDKKIRGNFAELQLKNVLEHYQNILDLALEFEPNLYQNAYKKKIYLTTPHTLFMALNTINISWRHIQSDENILKAFEELGKFYDKFAGILETFESIKRNANSLLSNVDKMQGQMSGRGGLILRVEKLKELGIITNKQIEKKSQENS